MKTVALLICSNIFMTIAWYGHLKFRKAPLLLVIVLSWLIAFAEYCFQVPANRIGYGEFTAFQLKVIQEVITLCVFVVFAWSHLGESVKWNHAMSFLLFAWGGRVCLLGKVVRQDCAHRYIQSGKLCISFPELVSLSNASSCYLSNQQIKRQL